jgi:hypothetical protein
MSFDAHITSNGGVKSIDGLQAKEALLTITMLASANDGTGAKAGMAATSEMWLVPEMPGMDELRAFNVRLGQELAVDMAASPVSGLLAAQPGGTEAMAELKKESTKLQGFPVLQVTRVGISPDGKPLPAPSVAPVASTQGSGSGSGAVAREVATDTGTQTANNEVGKLGTFGRALGSSSLGAFMRHKPSHADSAPAAAPSSGSPDAAGVLLESQTSIDHFSQTAVDATNLGVPAGYKQVTSPMVKNQ